jgi:hypothetical protein
MKHIQKILFLLFLLAAILVSCTEPIDINLDSSTIRLVVEGSLTTDTMSHEVKLSMTSSYFYNQPPQSVSEATVSISDGESIFNLTEASPGVYLTAPTVYGTAGKTYTLQIKLNSQVGGYSDYYATSKLNSVAKLDSITLLYHPEWSEAGMWEVKCFVQDPPNH